MSAELGYTVSGDLRLPAMLFLHGFMGSGADWAGVIPALDGRLRVACDLPGHGRSLGLPLPTYAIEGTARAVIGVLDALGIGRATFVGYSMGGRLALYLALRHPERCAGLFLESASPGLENASERAARREMDEEKAARLERDFEGFLRDWHRQPLFASLARDGELLWQTVEARQKNDPAELAKSLRGMGTGSQPSLWEDLAGLKVPTLAVAGELDEKFVGVSRRMESLSLQARTAVVPGVGHNVHVEAPAKFLSLLRGFLGGAWSGFRRG